MDIVLPPQIPYLLHCCEIRLIRNVLGPESGGAAAVDRPTWRRQHGSEITEVGRFPVAAAACIIIFGYVHINTTKRHDQGGANDVQEA
jgi:hypothetical protein